MPTYTVRVTAQAGPKITVTVDAPSPTEALEMARRLAVARWWRFGVASGPVTSVVMGE